MSFYDDMQTIAGDILNEFSQDTVKLVKLTPATGGTTDNPGTPIETEYTLDAAVSGVSFKYVQTGFAAGTDLQVTAAVRGDVTPSEDDFIEINSTRHKIVKDISVPASGTKVAWKFIVRKGG